MNIENVLHSSWFKKAVIAVGALLVLLLVFQAGVYVGIRKAGFSARLGDNYYRAVGSIREMPGPFGEELSGGEGAAGKVISVSLPTFVVEDRDNTEKIVSLQNTDDIKYLRDATSSGAITPGRFVIVIGEPDADGKINASFVRILPAPPDTQMLQQ